MSKVIRVSEEAYDYAVILSKQDDRTIANYLSRLIIQQIRPVKRKKPEPQTFKGMAEAWENHYGPGFNWSAKHRTKLLDIQKKIIFTLETHGFEQSEKMVIKTWRIMLSKMPEFYHKKLGLIEGNYNEIVADIQRGKVSDNPQRLSPPAIKGMTEDEALEKYGELPDYDKIKARMKAESDGKADQ